MGLLGWIILIILIFLIAAAVTVAILVRNDIKNKKIGIDGACLSSSECKKGYKCEAGLCIKFDV